MVVIVLSDFYHHSCVSHDEHQLAGHPEPKTSGASRPTSPRIRAMNARWHPLIDITCNLTIRLPAQGVVTCLAPLPRELRLLFDLSNTHKCGALITPLSFHPPTNPTLVNFVHTWACSTLQQVVLQRIVFLPTIRLNVSNIILHTSRSPLSRAARSEFYTPRLLYRDRRPYQNFC